MLNKKFNLTFEKLRSKKIRGHLRCFVSKIILESCKSAEIDLGNFTGIHYFKWLNEY